MRRSLGKTIGRALLWRLVNPRHLLEMARRARRRERVPTAAGNAQLKLYSQLLQGDFLHYGFFDDPDVRPEQISIEDFRIAQRRYAELIVERVVSGERPVLDVGCGMGGLLRMLAGEGHTAVGLTPDRFQVAYLHEKLPETRIIHAKFEEIDTRENAHRFGTVINSESLQYINLEMALRTVDEVLSADGRWVIADYFRIGEAADTSGAHWDAFLDALRRHHLRIVDERDITANVLPTLSCIHMWTARIGMPVFAFAFEKLQQKRPALHYLLEDAVDSVESYLRAQIEIVDPERFRASKKYMLLTVERE